MRRHRRRNEGVHVDAAWLVHAQRHALRSRQRLLEPLRSELHVPERLRQLPASDRDVHDDVRRVPIPRDARRPDVHELHVSVAGCVVVVFSVEGSSDHEMGTTRDRRRVALASAQ